MKSKMTGMFSKTFATAVAFVLVFTMTLYGATSLAFAAGGSSTATVGHAQKSGKVSINGINLLYDQSLTDNGDGTYTVNFDLSSSLVVQDKSEDHSVAKYGYIKAEAAGDYLIELWGGTGASGQDVSSSGGTGGKGGYMYAVITMAAGDYLFYTIGGKGLPTYSPQEGGGANGDGGDHGNLGNYQVGGGGGLSAVYYFPKGDSANSFVSTYLDSSGNLTKSDVTSTDRINQVVLVAGGGGGGGAGNGPLYSAVGAPNGGDAGSISGTGVAVAKGNYSAVAGTVYIGKDGSSSGKKTDYVGKGATYLPGEVNGTAIDGEHWELFDGAQPNNWFGTNNYELPAGSGGAGNFRGGAGGAGYAGGSGGIMTAALIPSNVGGGGGGSSFIASILKAPSATQKTYLMEEANNPSDEGGAINVSYVPSSTTFMESITFSGTISDYFDIVSVSGASKSGNTITASSLNLSPKTTKSNGSKATIQLVVKPKSGFMGGNDVNIFSGNVTVQAPNCSTDSSAKNLSISNECGYVNVPYAFELETFSYVLTDSDAKKTGAALFTDKGYSSKTMQSGMYKFIKNVSAYSITSGSTNYTSSSELPKENKNYTVSFTVTPTEGSKAVVGTRLETKTYSSVASIASIAGETCEINDNSFGYVKSLSYENGTYYYELKLTSSITSPSKNETTYARDDNVSGLEATSSTSFTAGGSGYYLIQAWGGKGAKGQDCDASSFGTSFTGGNGAQGGYVYSVVYLSKGQTCSIVCGASPAQASSTSGLAKEGAGGGGGGYTAVTISSGTNNGSTILVAGGGGGGGGAAKADIDMDDGGNGAGASANTTVNKVSSISLSSDTYGGKS